MNLTCSLDMLSSGTIVQNSPICYSCSLHPKMLLGCRNNFIQLSDLKLPYSKLPSSKYASFQRPFTVRCSNNSASLTDGFKEAKERIRETFGKMEISPSSYDTAWVAMVPSKYSKNYPCFPQCLDWIIENQREDGSWGLNPNHPLLLKDSLSSTLACLLALTKWRLGDNQVQRGLGFIEKHGWAVDDEDQISPEGFDIIFPSMIKYANKLNLELPLPPDLVNRMIHKCDLTIQRAKNDPTGNTENLEYVAEGLGELGHWEEIMMLHQRDNGSLFDSPATTAAALIYHQHNDRCFRYLRSILKHHESWVPTIYPTKIHSCLGLIDTLQNLGVDRYYKTEIKSVLDEICRLWQQKNEEIFSNVAHCAMAFRLLRMNNYEVSSEELLPFVNQEFFFRESSGQGTSDFAILELHQASQLAIHDEKDHILDKISTWTRTYMEQNLLDKHIHDRSKKEMERALRKFYATLDRVENRRYIESYDVNNFKISKAAYRAPNISNIDFLKFSTQDFNLCQARHKQDVQQLKRWFEDCKLDQVGFSQQYSYITYFLIASSIFQPEYAEARLAYVKNAVLVTLLDDFFDCSASEEELHNIFDLVQRWDEYFTVGYRSERVKIFFLALHHTIEDLAAKAHIMQGRYVKDHLINLWIEVLKYMLMEFDWSKSKKTPNIEEYLLVACRTIAVRCIVLTAQYLLGPKLPKDFVKSSEVNALANYTTTVARLLNDVQSYKREEAERSSNMVSALIAESGGSISEEEAIIQIKDMIETNRRQLLGIVLQSEGSQLPQVCKDLFWMTSKLSHFLYSRSDEFRSPEEINNHIYQSLHKPILNHFP